MVNVLNGNKRYLIIASQIGNLYMKHLLVGKKILDIKIADWEDMEDGLWLIDVSYMYVMLHAFAEGLPKHKKFLHDSFYELIKNNCPKFTMDYFTICELLTVAISTNRCFMYKLPIWEAMIRYLLFPFRTLTMLHRH
jgi:hypothetical protein